MRILIAEDKTEMAELLQKELGEENHFVNLGHNGQAALELAILCEPDTSMLEIMFSSGYVSWQNVGCFEGHKALS
jgi:DNA-binding response OmpR family regulator